MSSWTAQTRKLQADQRRRDREWRKRQKELDRQIKESEKLSELEQARLQVAAHENELDILLSVHREQSAPIEWAKFATALRPPKPTKSGFHEFIAILKNRVAQLEQSVKSEKPSIEEARALDEKEYKAISEEYERELAEWERIRALARRVLEGDTRAYYEAIDEFSFLSEIAYLVSLGSTTVCNPKLLECTLTVNGREAIPAETKSLTASGKLSVKAMPKQRFHEIYQDYVCSCVLRVAREMFALLPVEKILVTASVKGVDARTGKNAELPVLSVAFDRETIEHLDFNRLDPSDSMENFPHRGDVIASRKSGEFMPIVPLAAADLTPATLERLDFTGLLTKVQQLHEEIGLDLKPVLAANAEHTAIPSSST